MAEIDQHNDEKTLQRWVRIADCRRRTKEPDVDAEWERFKDKHIGNDEAPRAKTIHLWMAAIAGAAAMLAGVILYNHFDRNADTKWDEYNGLIVMRHSESPQLVTLSLGSRMVDMSDTDSLNLLDNKVLIDGKQVEEDGQMQTLSTPRGMDFKLILQDGTEVWLNAESTIDFPSSFVSNDTRRINLKGEAYFKVARDESKPFVVSVGDKEVRVLGTEFDIRNYSTEAPLVALVEGSIELCGQGQRQLLKPGQGATWNEGEQPKVQEIDTCNVTQWVEGLFYFDEQSLDEIMIDVARWYNVGIRFSNRQHAKTKIHFSASRTDSLERLLTDLQTVCGYKITLENKEIVVY